MAFPAGPVLLPPSALAQVEAPAKPPGDFAAEAGLEGIVWELSGYLTEDTRIEERSGWRARRVASIDGGPRATLAMKFGWMDPWPQEIELYVDSEENGAPGHGPLAAGDGPQEGDNDGEEDGEGAVPGGVADIRDRRPFGGENLTGLKGAGELKETLERYARGFRGGPRVIAGPWEGIGRGMALSESRALYGVRFGNPEVLVVKADPELWELAPYFSGEGGEDPSASARSVREWARKIPGAALVVNGGQYYADGSSMGQLSRDGREVESRRHPQWKGFLSSGPVEGAKSRPFAVADEELPRTGEVPGVWRNVLQSYMTLDRLGQVRVKSSAALASRTAIGEDAQGRICVVYVPGATSLYDLALILGDLEIFPAVSLDGGFESQMALRRGGGWSFYQGEYSHNALGNVFVRLYQPPLRLAAALVPARRPEPEAADGVALAERPGSESLSGEAPSVAATPGAGVATGAQE
jgi:hypothetical protein